MFSIGEGTTDEFFEKEFIDLNLNDKRLDRRAINIFAALQTKVTSCVNRLYTEDNNCRQTYDFFSNPKVSREKLMEPHVNQTVNRIKQSDSPYILAMIDQTYLNYSSHLAKTDLGRISKNPKSKNSQYGLIQHNVLCVNNKNEPLGLVDLKHFHYDDFNSDEISDKRTLGMKKTHFWVDSVVKMQALLGEDAKKIIVLADAESDFFEFTHALYAKNTNFVIRAKHNRCLDNKIYEEKKLYDLLNKADIIGNFDIQINDVKTREIKAVNLKIKRLESVSIPVTRWPKENNGIMNYDPIIINVVQVFNETYNWILLTTLNVSTIEDCKKISNHYKERWHIEDYHKVLKTGYQIDEIYLHSSREAIENALTVAAISACRLYYLIFIGRADESLKANSFFSEFEWKSIYVYFKEKIPKYVPPLNEVILKIAKLGGYKKKLQPPGVKTLWTGWQIFKPIAEMYEICSKSRKT